MKNGKDVRFRTVFDEESSISEPENRNRKTEDAGKVNSWHSSLPQILRNKDHTLNLISLIGICFYLAVMGIGFIVDLIWNRPEAISKLQQCLLPIVSGFAGWSYAKAKNNN